MNTNLYIPNLELECNDTFPDFLKNDHTGIRSLSMNGFKFPPGGEFDAITSSGLLLLGLLTVQSLKIENMSNFPAVILASCAALNKLEIRNVDFSNVEWKPVHRGSRPGPHTLTCTQLQDSAFLKLLSIIRVSKLYSLECELVRGELGCETKGAQHVLDLCGNILNSLTLRSAVSFQPSLGDESELHTTVCDLSQQVVLKQLTFTSSLHPEFEATDVASPRILILDQVLSTISPETRMLEWLKYKIAVPIDNELRLLPSRDYTLGLAYREPLEFFRQYGWRSLDCALARAASGRRVRVLVEVTGVMNPNTHELYDAINLARDNFIMSAIMKAWGAQIFVAVGKQRNIDFKVDARIKESPGY